MPFQIIPVNSNKQTYFKDFEFLSPTDKKQWVHTIERYTHTLGVTYIVSVAVKRIKELNYLINNNPFHEKVPTDEKFNIGDMDGVIYHYSLIIGTKEIYQNVQTPKFFNYDEWVGWKHPFITYLNTKKVITKFPLYYAIRMEPSVVPEV